MQKAEVFPIFTEKNGMQVCRVLTTTHLELTCKGELYMWAPVVGTHMGVG